LTGVLSFSITNWQLTKKAMKKGLFLLFVMMLAAPWAYAQQKDDITVEQVTVHKNGTPTKGGGDSYTQSYLYNVKFPLINKYINLSRDATRAAYITTKGDHNITTIGQSGVENIGAINISGNNNTTSLQQNGSRLFSILNVEGSMNIFDIKQHGKGLKNYIQLTGKGIHMNAVQTAKGMKLTQTGGTGIPLQIKTTGRRIPIIITNH
jgi:hypothetical protein